MSYIYITLHAKCMHKHAASSADENDLQMTHQWMTEEDACDIGDINSDLNNNLGEMSDIKFENDMDSIIFGSGAEIISWDAKGRQVGQINLDDSNEYYFDVSYSFDLKIKIRISYLKDLIQEYYAR